MKPQARKAELPLPSPLAPRVAVCQSRDSPAESRPMRLAAPFLSLFIATCNPVGAEPLNLTIAQPGAAGAATRLVLAQATYQSAMAEGDAVMLLVAIRLARGVTLRPPTGWTRSTTGDAAAGEATGRKGPVDPGSPQVLSIVQALASEEPFLQDLVFDLGAQQPHGRQTTAIEASADLSGGQTDTWRVALSGQVPAELGLIGDADSPLGMSVRDESGAVVCILPPSIEPSLCRFVPARNGFFKVTVNNAGSVQNSYRLIAG